MIVDGVNMNKLDKKFYYHGLPYTKNQIHCLDCLYTFIFVNQYSPTNKELSRICKSNESQVAQWMVAFERERLIARENFQRSARVTSKGMKLIAACRRLEQMWESYLNTRISYSEEFSTDVTDG